MSAKSRTYGCSHDGIPSVDGWRIRESGLSGILTRPREVLTTIRVEFFVQRQASDCVDGGRARSTVARGRVGGCPRHFGTCVRRGGLQRTKRTPVGLRAVREPDHLALVPQGGARSAPPHLRQPARVALLHRMLRGSARVQTGWRSLAGIPMVFWIHLADRLLFSLRLAPRMALPFQHQRIPRTDPRSIGPRQRWTTARTTVRDQCP
jgi:hypothetical protein